MPTFSLAPRARRRALLAPLVLAAFLAGCSTTTWRILRYRHPDARNRSMFPTRRVPRAEVPFRFARATALRTDLDTLTVRQPDGTRVPFARYLSSRSVLAFLVVRDDTVLYETYRGGYGPATASTSFSVAKSVLSALVGVAVGEGKIRSLDDPVTAYVPELRGLPAYDGVTVRHLLGMKSGLRFTTTGRGWWADFRSDDAHVYYAHDLPDFLKHARRAEPPGTRWVYKDTDAELLGWVLARATGRSVAEYTAEKLWRRIGAEDDASWDLDHRGGMEKVSSGFDATARDYAKLGRLYLHGGRWEGAQVVPAEWVAASTAVDATRPEPEISTWWQMQHTLYWWHALQPPQGDFFADGSNGQRIWVDPRTRTVIVQLANDSQQDFPFRRVAAYLAGERWEYPRSIPALVRQAALSFGADSVRPTFARLDSARRARPEGYVITERAMNTVGTLLLDTPAHVPAAVAVLTIVTERWPGSAQGWANLADAYTKAGDPTRAAEALRRAAVLAPGDSALARRARSAAAR